MINALVLQGTFNGHFEDKDDAIAIFHQHIENVKQRVPPDKLLVYNVKQGWEPLCTFLGIQVPSDKPFPHLNERSSFMGNRFRYRTQACIASPKSSTADPPSSFSAWLPVTLPRGYKGADHLWPNHSSTAVLTTKG
jgi:Sulfotransferase domain